MKIKKLFLKKKFSIPFAVYMFLWILTAVCGTYDVRQLFDKQFQYGYPSFSNEKVKVINVESFYVYDLENEYNLDKIPNESDEMFRYKSRGIAIAPFIIIDNIAAFCGGLAGMGATRFNFWFFGYNWWYPIVVYWCV